MQLELEDLLLIETSIIANRQVVLIYKIHSN